MHPPSYIFLLSLLFPLRMFFTSIWDILLLLY